MQKLIKKKIELPFEVDKTYKLNFSVKGNFLIKKIDKNHKGNIIAIWGIYENSPHLGICPIFNSSRLMAEKIVVEEMEEVTTEQYIKCILDEELSTFLDCANMENPVTRIKGVDKASGRIIKEINL